MKRIYLDHAAATYLDSSVEKAMKPFYGKYFGNPSSIYKEGREARQAVEESRKKIAKIINASPEEIIFTSGGTEGNNLAIFGPMMPYLKKPYNCHGYTIKNHIITSKIEHPSVVNPVKELEKKGFTVHYLDNDRFGLIDLEDLKNSLTRDTVLVSVIYANHEIGTIQPIEKISKIIKDFNHSNNADVLLHIDACQAGNYLDLDVQKLGVDLMTVNGSKLYGPKGSGFLFVRRGTRISSLTFGGEQEKKIRPGTENTAGIVGLSKALEIAQKMKNSESKRLTEIRDYFIKEALKRIPETVLNGHPEKRLPNNVNISIFGIEGEAAILYLDSVGIACSTGSACTSARLEPSHVIMALGLPYEFSHGSLRFTMGRRTTKKELDYVLDKLEETVKFLRNISAIKTNIIRARKV